jgi:2OG-Fe(II) oxygenase superfamily
VAFLSEMDPETGFLSLEEHASRGCECAQDYQSASPFPHTVIDDFLPPAVLEMCLAEFPEGGGRGFNRDQEQFKTQFNPDGMSTRARTLFYAFNSRPFIRVMENITGIKGLVPDPYFLGAGFHQIDQGGHLSVHVDFNHHKPMNLERRINTLIYLNKDWSEDYGGQLELWNSDVSVCVKSIVPTFNRCVIFSTTENSFHGNPSVVKHPQGIPRRSIALYYYTSTWSRDLREHTTQFPVRKGSADRVDWAVKTRELIDDLLPPVVGRSLRQALKKGDKRSP